MRTIFTLFFVLSFHCVFSQSAIDLYLKVVDRNKIPIKNLPVTLTDENGLDYKASTDEAGVAFFLIGRGSWYNVSAGELTNFSRFEVPYRAPLEMKKTVIYQPGKMTPGYGPGKVTESEEDLLNKKNLGKATKKSNPFSTDQLWLKGDTVFYNLPQRLAPIDTAALVQVEVMDEKNKLLAGLLVKLADPKTKKVYAAKTKADGVAQFFVPLNKKLMIGIEELDGLKELETPKAWDMVMTISLNYTPTNIVQTVRNDTIFQQQDGQFKPTSSAALVNIHIHDHDNKPLPNEPVCLNDTKSKKIYAAFTNEEGNVQFLLPKGTEYELNFKYARNIDLLQYEAGLYSHTTNIEYGYRGSRQIEHFYETAKRDDKKFLIEFGSSKAPKVGMEGDSLVRYAKGFKVKFKKGMQVATPSFKDGKLYSDAGFYSTKFYCFDAATGLYRWGVNLSEGGISPAVISNDYVLVNTESCTLFVLDAKSGDLIWSKWLCPYLFTTPTVANNKVYVVYGNGIDQFQDKNGNQNYVLACFDLPTGKIEWQAWLDEDGLVTPVVAANSVYVTTRSGSLYQFSAKTGELNKRRAIGATTAPTIVGNRVYVSCVDRNKQTEHVEIFQAGDLAPIKSLGHLSGKIAPALKMNYACHLMNYQGSRTSHYKGLNYNVIGNRLICTQLETGAVLWKTDFLNDTKDTINPVASFPIVCAGMITVATQSGKFNFYEPKTGKLLKSFSSDSQLWGQPVMNKGVIYCGTRDGKLVSFDTKDVLLDGVKLWGVSPSHNPVFD